MLLPDLDFSFGNANASTDGNQLSISTGVISRTWQWTDRGFASSVLKNLENGRVWSQSTEQCAWQLPDGTEPSQAKLISLTATASDDAGFTSEHLCVVAELAYPDAGLQLKFIIWAYPDAPGLRTQFAVKRIAGEVPASDWKLPDARTENLPLETAMKRRFFGYYNDTQRRNETHTDILKEDEITHPLVGREWCNWASVACLEDETAGFALVQESHKCVNQSGYASGGFTLDAQAGISLTGWGLRPSDIAGEYITSWANWTVIWTGDSLARETALKRFDQVRFPIDAKRDIYIQANTWGSGVSGPDSRIAATEPSVLEEIKTCAELGIDVLQIDDGWQVPPGHHTWNAGEDANWQPHPESYPEGWKNVREEAAKQGVKLGLWAASTPVKLKELKENYTDGGFVQFKLDFANLKDKELIDAQMHKVREFIQWTGHRARVNWDVTENPPRYGYYFAREYGSIYLENRKPLMPRSTVYRPHTVLRDLWQVAKYLPLHRFQCSIQNLDMVDRDNSDAHQHTHAYAVAIALMGIPLFFLETKHYSEAAKADIKPLLETYKTHRESIYSGMVHPIGQQPDNASWTGFQCHNEAEQCGYLTIFRELGNAEPKQAIKLHRLRGKAVTLTDLYRNQQMATTVNEAGELEFSIDQAPGFIFLRYEY